MTAPAIIARRIIDAVRLEHGEEVFIGEGYAPDDDLVRGIVAAIDAEREAHRSDLRVLIAEMRMAARHARSFGNGNLAATYTDAWAGRLDALISPLPTPPVAKDGRASGAPTPDADRSAGEQR